MSLTIRVVSAKLLSDYTLSIQFSDNSQQVLNFKDFLDHNPHPQYNKYNNPSRFKNFKIEHGNIVWGKDWDLIFPVEQLHAGKLN
jgi:hypothetical protein